MVNSERLLLTLQDHLLRANRTAPRESIIINEYFASLRLPQADDGGFLPLSKSYHSWASLFKSRKSR